MVGLPLSLQAVPYERCRRSAPDTTGASMQTTTVRWCGAAAAAGGVLWSLTWLVAGVPEEGVNQAVEIWGSFAFQLGVVALLVAMRGTDAAGTSRWGRWLLSGQAALMALAIAWTVPHLVDPNYQAKNENTVLVVLDAAWPLSMLGLVFVGVAVARARRWPTPLRWFPLAAGLLIPVDIAAMLLFGPWTEIVVRAAYMSATYGALGVLLVREAPLVVARNANSRAQPEPLLRSDISSNGR